MISTRILNERLESVDSLLETITACERALDGYLGDLSRPSIYPSVISPPPSPPAERLLRSMAESEETLALALAERIREARLARGWRQQDLADATGIARPNIARIESGSRMPKIGTLKRIGQALGLSIDPAT